ncbi:putative lipoprotein [Hyphomonas neptunium ATCC 15444]|uniref:Putative lipoprotein n=2 Tax=Hyphomonas TaxID=85 RepID=Q0C654_HYPNA|nr:MULTISPECIES: hypothetical protein [Hyphomonas]ABI75360.1 putative lipoprotein [Hyphomonas neptunium ATCC 15444]KCZ94869.1 putative lipoprotein [Hyphomonas hirschiana VP5]
MINFLKPATAVFAAGILAACATPATNETVSKGDKITAAMEGKMTDDGTVVACRSMQVTGSRFPAKECKSEKAWKEFDIVMAENAKSSTDRIQRLTTGCSTQGEGTC